MAWNSWRSDSKFGTEENVSDAIGFLFWKYVTKTWSINSSELAAFHQDQLDEYFRQHLNHEDYETDLCALKEIAEQLYPRHLLDENDSTAFGAAVTSLTIQRNPSTSSLPFRRAKDKSSPQELTTLKAGFTSNTAIAVVPATTPPKPHIKKVWDAIDRAEIEQKEQIPQFRMFQCGDSLPDDWDDKYNQLIQQVQDTVYSVVETMFSQPKDLWMLVRLDKEAKLQTSIPGTPERQEQDEDGKSVEGSDDGIHITTRNAGPSPLRGRGLSFLVCYIVRLVLRFQSYRLADTRTNPKFGIIVDQDHHWLSIYRILFLSDPSFASLPTVFSTAPLASKSGLPSPLSVSRASTPLGSRAVGNNTINDESELVSCPESPVQDEVRATVINSDNHDRHYHHSFLSSDMNRICFALDMASRMEACFRSVVSPEQFLDQVEWAHKLASSSVLTRRTLESHGVDDQQVNVAFTCVKQMVARLGLIKVKKPERGLFSW